MRALIVLPAPPCAEGGAAARCAIGLMRGLRGHGIAVAAIAARYPFAHAGPVPDDLDVEVVSIDTPARRSRSRPFSRWFHLLADLKSPALAARIEARARHADVVHFDQVEAAVHGPCVDVPSAVHLHYRVRDNPLRGPRPTGELRHRVELALAERRALASFPWLIANSAEVASTMGRPDRRVTIAALSIDVAPGIRAGLDGAPRLGIIGTASWPPTRAALRRLVERIWPAVRRRVPGAELHVAGRGTAGMLQGLDGRGIVLAGEVSSATEFLAGLSALVYPVPRGSGMKVKVLESLAIGLPVITTAAGAEGIARSDGVLVGNDDAKIADYAVELLANEALRHERGAAGHRTFAACFTPERATEPLVHLYRSMQRGAQDLGVEGLIAARDGRP